MLLHFHNFLGIPNLKFSARKTAIPVRYFTFIWYWGFVNAKAVSHSPRFWMSYYNIYYVPFIPYKIKDKVKMHDYWHSSEIRGLCLMKLSSEKIQNLQYFWNKKTHIVFCLFFISCYFFPPNECPSLFRHRPGH